MDLPPKEKEREIRSGKVEPVSPPRPGLAKVVKSAAEEKKIESPSRACDVILLSVSDELEQRYRELVDRTIRSSARLSPSTGFASMRPSGREFLIRALDIVGSASVLLVAMPVMLVVAVLVKISSEGPVFYKQQRVGQSGRIFTLYKFRTMAAYAGKCALDYRVAKQDPRVTSIGRFLRTSRLDELPQLFNVLKGDMSLVGPRPERPYFVKRYKFLQGVRLAVKPGLTGLAQVRSFYGLKPKHRIKYDYLYIQKRSLLLNLYVLLKTIPVIFFKKGW